MCVNVCMKCAHVHVVCVYKYYVHVCKCVHVVVYVCVCVTINLNLSCLLYSVGRLLICCVLCLSLRLSFCLHTPSYLYISSSLSWFSILIFWKLANYMCSSLHPDPALPDTGFTAAVLRYTSSVFVQPVSLYDNQYGTRSATSSCPNHRTWLLVRTCIIILQDKFSGTVWKNRRGHLHWTNSHSSRVARETRLDHNWMFFHFDTIIMIVVLFIDFVFNMDGWQRMCVGN